MDSKQVSQTLKNAIGQWMFQIMSRMTKEQFIIILQNYKEDPDMEHIKTVMDDIKKKHKNLCDLSTDRQLPYVGKPFFHGIKYAEAQESPDQTYVNLLRLELDDFTSEVADVTQTIRNVKEFSSFAQAIQSIFYQDESRAVQQAFQTEYSDAITKALGCAVQRQQQQKVVQKNNVGASRQAQAQHEDLKDAIGCSVKMNFTKQQNEDDSEMVESNKPAKQWNLKEAFKKADDVMSKVTKRKQ